MDEPPLDTAVLYKGHVWVAQLGVNGVRGTVWRRVTGRGSSFQRWEYFNDEAVRIPGPATLEADKEQTVREQIAKELLVHVGNPKTQWTGDQVREFIIGRLCDPSTAEVTND